MINVKIYDYFAFGFNYYLVLHDSSDRTNEKYYHWFMECLDRIENLEMPVTNSSMRLKGFLNEVDKLRIAAEDEKTKDLKIDDKLHESINGILKKIDHTLDAEINLKQAYILEEKRISNEILLGEIHKLFPKGYFLLLSDIAQYDLNECGFCLAFNRYTASAFHALRATEEMLKIYYEKLLNMKASDKDNWGTFVSSIQGEINKSTLTPVPNEELLINLDNLRKYYRNKTQHPQLIYTSDEVQDLIPFCIKTITQILKDLKNRNVI
jgi:hypothetical protein